MDSVRDQLEEMAPIATAGDVAIGVAPVADDEPPPTGGAPAGAQASYPIAHLVVLGERLACKRLFPEAPLTEEELAEIKTAAQAIEDWYAPQIGGPWWLWAQLIGVHAAIYGPRMIDKKRSSSRKRLQEAAGGSPAPAPQGFEQEPKPKEGESTGHHDAADGGMI